MEQTKGLMKNRLVLAGVILLSLFAIGASIIVVLMV